MTIPLFTALGGEKFGLTEIEYLIGVGRYILTMLFVSFPQPPTHKMSLRLPCLPEQTAVQHDPLATPWAKGLIAVSRRHKMTAPPPLFIFETPAQDNLTPTNAQHKGRSQRGVSLWNRLLRRYGQASPPPGTFEAPPPSQWNILCDTMRRRCNLETSFRPVPLSCNDGNTVTSFGVALGKGVAPYRHGSILKRVTATRTAPVNPTAHCAVHFGSQQVHIFIESPVSTEQFEDIRVHSSQIQYVPGVGRRLVGQISTTFCAGKQETI